MAYMFAFETRCNKDGCTRAATHRVCNQRNDTMGNFCKRHAEQRVKDLQETEDRINEAARNW